MLMSGDCWQQWLCLDSTNKYNISRTTLPIKLSSCIKLLLKANVQFATSQNDFSLIVILLLLTSSDTCQCMIQFDSLSSEFKFSKSKVLISILAQLLYPLFKLRPLILQGVSGSTGFHLVAATTGGQLEPNLVARTPHGLAIDPHNVHMLPPTF